MSDDGRHSSLSELDSHADTCAFGSNSFIVQETGEPISVEPFLPSLGKATRVPIVTAAVAYDCHLTCQTYILFFHQVLYIKDLGKNLISPFQLRHHGIIVNDIPLIHLSPEERAASEHSLSDAATGLHIPLSIRGTHSVFPTRKPTLAEIQSNDDCIHVQMTCEAPWDPYDAVWKEREASLRGQLEYHDANSADLIRDRTLMDLTNAEAKSRNIGDLQCCRASVAHDVASYASTMNQISLHSVQTNDRKGRVTAEELARRWRCGTKTAERTLSRTTQRAVRDFTHTTGGRRLKPYAYMLRYPRLNVEMYTDTLIGRCRSLLGNLYLQVYSTSFHFIAAFPMPAKANTHNTLDSLFRRHGIPRVLIPDNGKEMTQGEFKRKAQRFQCAILPIEPYTPNANLA